MGTLEIAKQIDPIPSLTENPEPTLSSKKFLTHKTN